MPSPIPATRLLSRDLYPCVELSTCSSPLHAVHGSSSLQVPPARRPPRLLRRPWSSVIHWEQLRAVEPVGSGGFGSVYRAEYLGETVALKKVKKSSRNQLASRQSFWAELNPAHLQHPNIVRVLAATTCVPAGLEEEGCIGTVLMEFVGSRNLQQVLDESPEPLERARWSGFSRDIVTGLAFLHAHGLVHLDIKPANILLSSSDVCKIADFGCSVKLERDMELSSVSPHLSHVCGTYTHRAPELLRGQHVSSKADIFSFGITLWQLLTRQPPYTGDRQHVQYAVVAQHLRPSLRDHAVFRTALGQSCSVLLRRCWSAEARCRPSARDLLDLLDQVHSDLDLDLNLDLVLQT